ncbi:MAG: 3-phosphoshikimate 1-carboxyvinyltransferase [Algisphaera sp.]
MNVASTSPNKPLPESLLVAPLRSPFDLSIAPPGSKSLTNRALLLAALADGRSTLTGVLFADDTRRMLEALIALGFDVAVDEPNRKVTVTGAAGRIPNDSADLMLGNAGTAVRFLTAALALGEGPYTVDGIARMRERPIGQLVDPLHELGAEVEYLGEDRYPPLKIHGLEPDPMAALQGGNSLTLHPTLSSQFVSALLQIGPCLVGGLELKFEGPITSKPYVKMTLDLMEKFGTETVREKGYRTVRVRGRGYTACNYAVEPDASNATYFLAAAAVTAGARVMIPGLGSESLQGDAEFCDVLGRMGCGVIQKLKSTQVTGPTDGRLRAIEVDLNDMPDTAQTLAVVALFAEGTTVIRNVGNLRVKETDRMAALETELTKLGATVVITGDDLSITPPFDGKLTAAAIDTYDDHRMAMAFSVAGLRSQGVTINDPACVNKTYPTFFEDLEKL